MKNIIKQGIKAIADCAGYEIVRVDDNHWFRRQADKSSQHSQSNTDVFYNDFRFNMFVERELDDNVKRIIIAQTFYKNVGYYPNINHPKTFSEKVLWLKLYYHNDAIRIACDKALGKGYIDSVLGPGYTVPIIKTYNSVEDIDLDELPQRFVLKVNWATGCNIIVKDKSEADLDKIKYDLDRWTLPWKSSYYGTFNAGYRDVKPIIFAEEYLDIPHNTTEYKLFCSYGKLLFTLFENDYFGKEPTRAYYDRNGNEVPWQFGDIKKITVDKMPDEYQEMIKIAEKVSEPFPYIRVDFYDINGKLYIGELTFYSGGGFSHLNPREWDNYLGEKLDITGAMKEMGWNIP